MTRLIVCCAAASALVCAAPAGADEIDDLVKKLSPPARFRDYRANFRAERRTFTFNHVQGPVQRDWWLVRDGEKYVALHRGGDFNLLALTPELAKTTLAMPTGRYHLDNQLGPTLCTHQFLKPVKTHGAIYSDVPPGPEDAWVGGGKTLTFVRSFKTAGQATTSRFTFSVDPVLGYRIDGLYDVRFKDMPVKQTWVGPTFCPGCHPPWPANRIYNRTVHCPGFGQSGYRGWANNLLCMDRCDGDRKKNSWRDGGFIAHLTAQTGWSACRTRVDGGGDVSMPVCNAHNDFHVHILLPGELPKDETGRYRFQALHRLLALPPELTQHIWDNMDLFGTGGTGVFISVGEVEGFEDQPKSLAEPERGLTWTSGGPNVSTDEAYSGRKSLLLTGTSWPNLPEVCCLPESKYRVEAYFKVVPWTAEETAAARKKDEARREQMKKRGRPLPPEVDWDNLEAQAYITAHFYEWSPHSGKWLVRQETTRATGAKKDWQRVVLQFDTPKWDPKVNIVFQVHNGKAYLDDFSLLAVRDPTGAPLNLAAHPATQEELGRLGCTDWPTWSCEPKSLKHHYDKTETCYVTEGEVDVVTAVGTVTIEAGHLAVFPKGLDCTWNVRKAVKKHYKFD